MHLPGFLIFLLAFFATFPRCLTAEEIVLRIRGPGVRSADYTLSSLRDMDRLARKVREHDGEEAEYEGVSLGLLIQDAGVAMRGKLRGGALKCGVLVKAKDGYAALFSVAELDPDMNDRWVFLADTRDGKPLPPGQGPLRLIVPDDKRHARWVREVVELEILSGQAGGNDPEIGALSGTVAVAAASDLVHVLGELGDEFRRRHPGVEVRVTTGASGSLAGQIRKGAPFDVFLSADIAYPRGLADAGFADAATLRPYAMGRLVLWTLRTNLDLTAGLAVLTNATVSRVAMANPDVAPYGRAARAALEKAGLLDAVRPRLAYGENIAQTAVLVETGNADVGFVGRPFIHAPAVRGKGKWWVLPEDSHPVLEQAGILAAPGRTNAAARAYLDFVVSDAARAILGRHGFDLPGR